MPAPGEVAGVKAIPEEKFFCECGGHIPIGGNQLTPGADQVIRQSYNWKPARAGTIL